MNGSGAPQGDCPPDPDINLVDVENYIATYGWDSSGSIMWAEAYMDVDGDDYDQHIIKDFWDVSEDKQDPEHQVKIVRDEGLEVITKLDFPRTKWFQESIYIREDGQPGKIDWIKTQIAPFGSDLCKMTFTGDVDVQSGIFTLFNGRLIIETQ